MKDMRRAAVLGAGVMGSSIAAHLANAGVRVLLLDLVPPDLPAAQAQDPRARNRLAEQGLKRALAAKPAAFISRRRAELVETGNLEDDLEKLAACDWVIEAVVEQLPIKQALFARVEDVVRPGTPVTSNTSGLSAAALAQGRDEAFRKSFFVTHFFNPPRYLKLVEFVPAPETDPALMQQLAAFCADRLGKGVIFAKDTPNFVANRIGTFALMFAIRTMIEQGLSIDAVDAIAGKPLGRPKSAAFRTADLVGLDTLLDVTRNCHENLPDDEMREVFRPPEFLERLVAEGRLGAKTGAGFYKKADGQILSLDWRTLAYVPRQKPRFESIARARTADALGERIKLLCAGEDEAARFAWTCTAHTLAYAARRVGEIADGLETIDRAMRWGFNWELGPFETWDALGVAETSERLTREGIDLPAWVGEALAAGLTSFYRVEDGKKQVWDVAQGAYRPLEPDPLRLELPFLKRTEPRRVILHNESASLVDLDDGVALLEFHSYMNAIDAGILELAERACQTVEEGDWLGLVVGNAGENFCVGANLMMILSEAMAKNWDALDRAVRSFQAMTQRFRTLSKPVVAAPFGLTLGGGAEIAMGCDAIRAHVELYMGLVEVGVGLIPAGGGCLMLLERLLAGAPDDPQFDPGPAVQRAFTTIGLAKVASSAEEAQELGFLDPRDGISFDRDRLLHDAKQTVLGLARAGYRPPLPRRLRLPGPGGAATLEMMLYGMEQGHRISAHDRLIGRHLARVLTGGTCSPATPVSPQHVLDLEREAFLSLCGEAKTWERMNHMLQHGKPLRN